MRLRSESFVMTPRERLIAALNHSKPDRLPRYEIFFQTFIDAWQMAKKLPGNADIREYYRIDVPMVLADQGGPFTREESTRETGGDVYYVRDSWGRLRKHLHSAAFFEVLETAIREKTELDHLVFEDPSLSDRWYRSLEEKIRQDEGRFAPVSGTMGLYQACTWLRGEIPFLMDLIEDEAFCRSLIDRVRRFLTALGEQVLVKTHTWDTAIWVYDDFSVNAGPLFGPDVFERLFLEPYRVMFAHWKDRGVRHIILHHDVLSPNSFPILDMFKAAGLTGVQGVYPTAGLSIRTFKERYGKSLSVVGGICNTHTLPFGNKRDIERQVAEVVEIGREGGMVVGSHSIEGYIPVEHYDWYIEALDKAEGISDAAGFTTR